jgi:hypothetical protein
LQERLETAQSRVLVLEASVDQQRIQQTSFRERHNANLRIATNKTTQQLDEANSIIAIKEKEVCVVFHLKRHLGPKQGS